MKMLLFTSALLFSATVYSQSVENNSTNSINPTIAIEKVADSSLYVNESELAHQYTNRQVKEKVFYYRLKQVIVAGKYNSSGTFLA